MALFLHYLIAVIKENLANLDDKKTDSPLLPYFCTSFIKARLGMREILGNQFRV